MIQYRKPVYSGEDIKCLVRFFKMTIGYFKVFFFNYDTYDRNKIVDMKLTLTYAF